MFRYRAHPQVTVRTAPGARLVEVLRVVLGAMVTGADLRLSLDPETSALLRSLDGRDADTDEALRILAMYVQVVESDDDFLLRIERGDLTGRVRLVGASAVLPALREEEARGSVTLFTDPVLANGRRELLFFLREQAISRTMHRYGHLDRVESA